MTKRVSAAQKAKRAGDGERPVRVGWQGKSLPSSQGERKQVVSDAVPALWGTI